MQLVPTAGPNGTQCFPGSDKFVEGEDLLTWLWESGALELALHRCWSCLWFLGVLLSGLSWLCSKAIARCRRSNSCSCGGAGCGKCKAPRSRHRGWNELPGERWSSPPGSKEQRRWEPPASNELTPGCSKEQSRRGGGTRRGGSPCQGSNSSQRGRSPPSTEDRDKSITPEEERRPPEAPAFLLGSVRAEAQSRAPAYVSRSQSPPLGAAEARPVEGWPPTSGPQLRGSLELYAHGGWSMYVGEPRPPPHRIPPITRGGRLPPLPANCHLNADDIADCFVAAVDEAEVQMNVKNVLLLEQNAKQGRQTEDPGTSGIPPGSGFDQLDQLNRRPPG